MPLDCSNIKVKRLEIRSYSHVCDPVACLMLIVESTEIFEHQESDEMLFWVRMVDIEKVNKDRRLRVILIVVTIQKCFYRFEARQKIRA